jgi:hypothetical protein
VFAALNAHMTKYINGRIIWINVGVSITWLPFLIIELLEHFISFEVGNPLKGICQVAFIFYMSPVALFVPAMKANKIVAVIIYFLIIHLSFSFISANRSFMLTFILYTIITAIMSFAVFLIAASVA